MKNIKIQLLFTVLMSIGGYTLTLNPALDKTEKKSVPQEQVSIVKESTQSVISEKSEKTAPPF